MKSRRNKDWKQQIELLYVSYQETFHHWARKQFPNMDIATIEDTYQDAIIAFIEALEKGAYDPVKSSEQTYLFSIARYMFYKKAKQKTREFSEISDSVLDQTVAEFSLEPKDATSRRLLTALEKLDARCRQLLKAFYYQKYSMDEIAEQLGMKNRNVVKVSKYRCLERIKKIMNV